MEGALSLGIYDKARKLVRTLHREASEKEFTVGLNGFTTHWDGKDDAGNAAAPGRYTARGYSVGELEVEGIAYHCNDWVVDEDSPRLTRFTAMKVREQELLLAGFVQGTRLVVVHQELGTGAQSVEKMDDSGTLLNGGSEQSVPSTHLPEVEELMREAQALGAPLRVKDEGMNGKTWVLENAGEDVGRHASVVQMDLAGNERLRELVIPAADPQPVSIAASKSQDEIFLNERAEGRARVRGLRLKAPVQEGDTETVSTWETFFEKNAWVCDTFAQVAGKLGRSQPFKPDEKITVKLSPNPLFKDKQATIDLQVAVDEKGSYFRTSDGLPLCLIAETLHVKWAVMGREGKDKSITVFQSDGAVVEEFRVKKPANMMAFDAGEYDWKP